MSHSSDSSCFKWTLVVELARWSCPLSSGSLSEPVVDEPEAPFSQVQLMGSAVCTPPVQPAHPGIGRTVGATPAQIQMPGGAGGKCGLA